jgi:hypothetical protein
VAELIVISNRPWGILALRILRPSLLISLFQQAPRRKFVYIFCTSSVSVVFSFLPCSRRAATFRFNEYAHRLLRDERIWNADVAPNLLLKSQPIESSFSNKDVMGTARSYISKLGCGLLVPSFQTLERATSALGIDIADLFLRLRRQIPKSVLQQKFDRA